VQARIVPAAGGARWLASGWQLFRASPFGWLTATLAYWFLTSLLALVPVVGGALAVLVVPAFSLGFMALARAAAAGKPLELAALFEGFRRHARTQLPLGALYLVAFAAALGAGAAADDGTLLQWVFTGRRPEAAGADDDAVASAAALAALAYLPVMAAFWFAPPLAAWHSLAPAKSLFFSFFACLMNWRAFIVFGAAALVLSAPLVLSLAIAPPLFVALLVLVLPILFASFYASYADVFGYHSAE
jgi:hypothetical protein